MRLGQAGTGKADKFRVLRRILRLDGDVPASSRFEELDYRQTPLGELILRRRLIPSLDDLEVHEVILGDAYLMTSLFTEVEQALSRLGLAAVKETVPAALRWRSWSVVSAWATPPGRRWKWAKWARCWWWTTLSRSSSGIEKGMVPLGPGLMADGRCRFVHGDFFELSLSGTAGFDPEGSDAELSCGAARYRSLSGKPAA